MDYFKKYSSNTLAGSGNQLYFYTENESSVHKCRVFYKIFSEGIYKYSFLFSNTIDSTYGSGEQSNKNMVVDSWHITEARVGVTNYCDESRFKEPFLFEILTFDGNFEKKVNPGELFASDPVELCFKSNEYICLELMFSGRMIPYHEESIIPSFVYDNGEWLPSKLHPFAAMIGTDRKIKKKIAFLGDSITQGIGTPVNSYAHWNSVLANIIGKDYSYWNLGLGFGRADDAASNGIWLYKAMQNDIVFVCYGVNDIFQGYTSDTIKNNIQTIVDKLKQAGITVIVQTVPPFDYDEMYQKIWRDVNDYIVNELKNADLIFDCAEFLAESENEPYKAKYGGHPNEEGCRIWGEKLAKKVLEENILSI